MPLFLKVLSYIITTLTYHFYLLFSTPFCTGPLWIGVI